jgi:hypothetical protein
MLASVQGTAVVRAQPSAFVAAFARRIETGLFPNTSRARCQYQIVQKTADVIRFRAGNWWTAINVGLNEVELSVGSDGRVRYAIEYPRWARYALALCGGVGVVFVAILLTADLHGYVEGHPESRLPGLSTNQNVAIAWIMALFWGFAWPWILILFHRRPLRRLMTRIVSEVDDVAVSSNMWAKS